MKKKAAEKSWTVMVYMAGDNNLDPEGSKDLREMKKVGSNEDVNIIAQFDRAAGHVARRYYLRKGGLVTGDAVDSLGNVNTGDPASLEDFIGWGIKNYPAEHYLLVLWNHGQGWDDTDVYADERYRGLRRLATGPARHSLFRSGTRRVMEKAIGSMEYRAILLDDNAKDFLDNQEMKKVLAGTAKRLGRKLDILGMDACLMSMAEVGYQISDSTACTVGSEQTEPGNGWPYDKILSALAKNPAMAPDDLCTLIVDKYLASYSEKEPVTQSACDLSKAEALASSVALLASELKSGIGDPAVLQAIQGVRNKVQSYDVRDNIDLVDFCSLLAKTGVNASVKTACQNVATQVQNSYVMKQGYKNKSMQHSGGVAIYFPLVSVSPLYPKLEFSRKTGWDSFLVAYLEALKSR
ncbi:MAG: peptidase C11 [Chlorobiaceae bacterium]|nr:peptidase C11 [Chlorobiaceae bacterium]NTV61138.1 peptidase C11 [Chlorobiaceae bacterium]